MSTELSVLMLIFMLLKDKKERKQAATNTSAMLYFPMYEAMSSNFFLVFILGVKK